LFLNVPYSPRMAPRVITPEEQLERERVGTTLRTLRSTRGWKLGDFATKIGVSYAYLSNIEAGRKPLPDHLLARAAKILDVDQIAIKHPVEAVA
jgi:transcriptional regulator with XRE-family HTH domain